MIIVNFKCLVLCRNNLKPKITPAEPPIIAIIIKRFSGTLQFPARALDLSRPINKNPIRFMANIYIMINSTGLIMIPPLKKLPFISSFFYWVILVLKPFNFHGFPYSLSHHGDFYPLGIGKGILPKINGDTVFYNALVFIRRRRLACIHGRLIGYTPSPPAKLNLHRYGVCLL